MNTQISKITTLFLNYPKMLRVWNATEFVFLSDECVGFKISTPSYKGASSSHGRTTLSTPSILAVLISRF